jgi:hypothetical protein
LRAVGPLAGGLELPGADLVVLQVVHVQSGWTSRRRLSGYTSPSMRKQTESLLSGLSASRVTESFCANSLHCIQVQLSGGSFGSRCIPGCVSAIRLCPVFPALRHTSGV